MKFSEKAEVTDFEGIGLQDTVQTVNIYNLPTDSYQNVPIVH